MHQNLRKLLLTAMALILTVLPGLAAADTELGGHITVLSDYMFRGVSQTMSGTALQGELNIEHDSGWYGYVWASNVDFTDSSTPDDGARAEINLAIGYEFSVSDNVTAGFERTAYIIPGTHAGYDYNYEEWHGSVTVNDRHSLTVGYSDDVFSSGSNGTFYAFDSSLDVSEQLSLGLQFGHYDLNDSYDMTYRYAELRMAGELESIAWQISYFTTTDEAEELFYESTIDDRLVLSLSLSF